MLSIEDINRAGFEGQELAEGIYVVPNLILESEITLILDEIASLTDSDWFGYYETNLRDFAEREYGTRNIEKLTADGVARLDLDSNWADKNIGIKNTNVVDAMNNRINRIFSHDPSLTFSGVGTIQRQYEGAPLNEHVDSQSEPTVAYAVVAYINDDYEGGELYFPKLGLEIKPHAGSVIIFPSSDIYLHGVKSPKSGPIRYALPAFVHRY